MFLARCGPWLVTKRRDIRFISTRILIFVHAPPAIVDGTTVLVNITMTVPQTEEVKDTLSNCWRVVCLARISNAGLRDVRAVVIAWPLVPVGSRALGPTLVTRLTTMMLTVVRMRTTVGGLAMTTTVTGSMSMTGTTAATTSPGY
jgi:hypothetical protein